MKTRIDSYRYRRAIKKHQRRHRPSLVERMENAIREYISVNVVVFAIIAVPVAVGLFYEGKNLFFRIDKGRYQMPAAYMDNGEAKGSITVLVRADNWRPIGDRLVELADTIEIRIDDRPLGPHMSDLYDDMFDGSPRLRPHYGWDQIERTYRAEPEMTVQEMGNMHDVIIPDQDRATMPRGLIQCTRQAERNYPEPMCWLRFDLNGERWRIRFARRHLGRHTVFRNRAIKLMKEFRRPAGAERASPTPGAT